MICLTTKSIPTTNSPIIAVAPRACRTTASAYPGPIVPYLNCRIALVANAPLPKSHAKPTGRGTRYWERASPKSRGRAGQMLQGAVDQISHALFVSPIIWARSGVCYRRGFPKRVEGYELAPARRVSARIERDLINPSGEFVRVAQPPKAFVRANKGLLAQVACIVSIARVTQDKVVDGALPTLDQGIKGRGVPGLELRDQRRIIHREKPRVWHSTSCRHLSRR